LTRVPIFYLLSGDNGEYQEKLLECAERGLNTRILEKENYNNRDWRKKAGKTKKMAKRTNSLRPRK